MKKIGKVSALVCATALMVLGFVSCANSSSSNDGDGGTGGGPAKPQDIERDAKIVADWQIAPGYQNTVDQSKLKISAVKSTDGKNCMKVIWSASADFKSCELYAMLPNATEGGTDYGEFDGIQFDVKLPASANFLLLLRNPNGGTTAKIWEDFVYRGTDVPETYVWVTVKKPFADAVDTTWGPAMEGTLKEWLTKDKATQKQVNLNPILNVGGGSEVDKDQVTYFDNIGFYKAGATEDADVFTPVWDFE